MTVSVAHIRSVGTALPGAPVENAVLGKFLGMGSSFEQWVATFVGIRTRHLSIDLATGEVRYSLADLGETAGRRALAAAGLRAGDIDLVVMGTSMPDTLMPTTVNIVADRLGIGNVPTYQLQSGCTGAMQALDVAHQLLLGGRHRTALVLGGDVCAKHVDLSLDYGSLPPQPVGQHRAVRRRRRRRRAVHRAGRGLRCAAPRAGPVHRCEPGAGPGGRVVRRR